MIFKRHRKHIFGAEFSKAEQKIIDEEIGKQISAKFQEAELEIDAMFLWYLHEKHRYGPKALTKAYRDFSYKISCLADYYELGEDDAPWLCKQKLKDIGVDLDKLSAEVEEMAKPK